MKLVTEDKVVLSSVGCVIDKSTGITFPIHTDDTIDWDGGTHIHDIENEEWFESLSEKDIRHRWRGFQILNLLIERDLILTKE